MPRAAEYRHAAEVLRRRSSALSEAATAYRRHRIGEFGDGPIGSAHDEAMTLVATRFDAAGEALSSLAIECEHRARVCDGYATAISTWKALDQWGRLVTPFPQPPAKWTAAC